MGVVEEVVAVAGVAEPSRRPRRAWWSPCLEATTVRGSGSTVAKGSATITYDATQTIRSASVSVTNVNLPDGIVMEVDFLDDGLTEPGPTTPCG